MTDWPMFWVQVAVGVGTIALAGVSVFATFRALGAAKKANELSMEASAVAAKAHEREVEKTVRSQASKVWVSMIVVTDESWGARPTHGVLLIRNSSERPVTDVEIQSRGWDSAKRAWFPKAVCRVAVLYPGDTFVRSQNGRIHWGFPEHAFPHFSAEYNHAGGPRDDPNHVLSVTFTDADGRAWELTKGHRLQRSTSDVDADR